MKKIYAILLFILISIFSFSQEIVINEVNVNPSGADTTNYYYINSNSLYNLYTNYQPPINKEWIELFNPSSTESIDISCYTFGANTSDYLYGENWGALTFPQGTIIPPLGYIIIGGNYSEVPQLDFDLNYYRNNFFQIQYLDGSINRWYLRNSYGWCALYNPNGEAVDAIYWTDSLGNENDLYIAEPYTNTIISTTTCSGVIEFPAAIDIPNIEFVGKIFFDDLTFQRVTDGSNEWGSKQEPSTPRNCNGGCFDYFYQNVCEFDTMYLKVINLTYNQVDSVLWDFGDYSSGPLNYSNDTTTYHYYSDSGNYSVKLIVYFGYNTDTIIKSVSVYNSPLVNLGYDIFLCPNETTTLHAGSGFTNYLWSNGSVDSILNVSLNGNYWVSVSTSNCTDIDTINVSNFNINLLNLGNDTSICNNESITFYAGNGFASYLWQNNNTSQSINTNQAGMYWVEVIDVNSCKQRDSVNLYINQPPFIELGNDTLLCNSLNIILDALNSGAIYIWSTYEISQQINVSTSGLFKVTITNNCGDYIDSISVSFNQKPQIVLNDTTICNGDSTILSINNIYDNYIWSTGETTNEITAKDAASYSVSVSNICGTTIKTMYLNNIAPPITDLGNDTLICNDTLFILNAQNVNSSYNWSTNETTQQISVSESGKYSVTVTNQCAYDTSSKTITFDKLPNVNIKDSIVCKGDSINLFVNDTINNIEWSTGENSNNIYIKFPGNYTVKLVNNCGNYVDTFKILQEEKPVFFLGNDTIIEKGNSIILTANFPNTTCLWSTQDTSHSISVEESGYYWAKLKNYCGITYDTIFIEINNCKINIVIPNSFSPNGDGINDALFIQNECNTVMNFDVYTRWGALVYKNSAKIITWEGTTFSGVSLSDGVYYYILTFKNSENMLESFKGFIQLFK